MRCVRSWRRRGADDQIYEVAGKADTDPFFPDDPYIAGNRRVTITLMREAPPVPPDLKPWLLQGRNGSRPLCNHLMNIS